MQAECPLCGRAMTNFSWESYYSPCPKETAYQIQNLNKVMDDIISGKECITLISDEQIEMCPLCQTTTDTVCTDSKKAQLLKRIASTIEYLKARRMLLLTSDSI